MQTRSSLAPRTRRFEKDNDAAMMVIAMTADKSHLFDLVSCVPYRYRQAQ
jgi:hypothetical protein